MQAPTQTPVQTSASARRAGPTTACAVCGQHATAVAAFCSRCGSRLARVDADPATTATATAATATTEGGVPRQARLASLLERLDAEDAGTWAPPAQATGAWAPPAQDGPTQAWPGAGEESDLSVYDDGLPEEAFDEGLEHAADADPAPRRRSRRLLAALAALVVVTAALVAGVAALLLHGLPGGTATSGPTGSTPGGAAPSAAAPAAPAPSAAAAGGASLDADATATAPQTSPDGTDGNGSTTSYAASQMLDGDPDTAWRMDGDGAGSTLTFTLAAPHAITRLGLVNGYAKVDPASGTDRYAQERRITRVTWIVDGRSYPQSLSDGVRGVQAISVPSVSASSVQLRIDATTAPGAAGFDKTAISDVLLGG